MTLPPRSFRDKEFLLHLRERLRQKNRPYNCCPPLLQGWVTHYLHPGSWYGSCYVQRIP
jgi:hypothetical protein